MSTLPHALIWSKENMGTREGRGDLNAFRLYLDKLRASQMDCATYQRDCLAGPLGIRAFRGMRSQAHGAADERRAAGKRDREVVPSEWVNEVVYRMQAMENVIRRAVSGMPLELHYPTPTPPPVQRAAVQRSQAQGRTASRKRTRSPPQKEIAARTTTPPVTTWRQTKSLDAWDMAAEICLTQLLTLLEDPNADLQNLNLHSFPVMVISSKFFGKPCVTVGIFPYVLKLLQTTTPELRQILVFIWTKVLALDKASSQSKGLASIHDLRYVWPCPELFKATTVYWDPFMHVFRFYDDEMCPTVEEFQAYLRGFTNSHVFAVPPLQENMEHLLRMTLNISEELSASIVQNGKLNIIRFIELYGPEGILEDYVEQAHRHFPLSIYALAAYMLIPADGRVSPSLVSQMGAWKNIMPIVLAETLMGLHLVKSGEIDSFSAPAPGFIGFLVFMLVQLWLLEKMGVLEAPRSGFDHFPRHLLERPMLYPELLIKEWFAFLNDMQFEDIVWRCPWLNLPEMTVNSTGFERVVIAGLTGFTFYIPGCIFCQLGMSQGNQRFGTEDFEPLDFDAPKLHNYRCSWNNMDLEGPFRDFRTMLENCCMKWLHEDVMARLGGYY
ncbi:hypothetical protein RHMOL_Rhmol11G0010300 [Rhododendron molle]|uniref:Uncharacterized protein n=1 Tax=Rhododendron molle TaxID=49168 RepID=A0ACC0LMP1_RHOML|nr:hypothetical protein RHMOL_Rhmol11G0010300 [Rhododendron molle]